jgi:hypothetical protein
LYFVGIKSPTETTSTESEGTKTDLPPELPPVK